MQRNSVDLRSKGPNICVVEVQENAPQAADFEHASWQCSARSSISAFPGLIHQEWLYQLHHTSKASLSIPKTWDLPKLASQKLICWRYGENSICECAERHQTRRKCRSQPPALASWHLYGLFTPEISSSPVKPLTLLVISTECAQNFDAKLWDPDIYTLEFCGQANH